MKKITYDGITYDGDHVTETSHLPNEMKLDGAINYVMQHNGTDGEDIRYYQVFRA